METLFGLAVTAVTGVVKITLSIPGRIVGVFRMSSAERGEMYRGWWTTIKKESYHYWVRPVLLVCRWQSSLWLSSRTSRLWPVHSTS